MQRAEFEQWKAAEVARLLALVETERRYYQDIFAVLPVPVAILDGETNVVAANREFRKRFSFTPQELGHRKLTDLLPDAAVAPYLSTAQAFQLPPLDIAEGRLSARKIAGWEDVGSDELLVVLEQKPGAEGPSWEELDSLGIKPWTDVSENPESIHPADRDRVLAFIDDPSHATRTLEYRVLTPEDEVRWRRDTLTESGGFTRDITLEKRAARQQVEAAKRESIEHLAGRVAHIANNLLMIVGGYAEELAESLPADDARRDDIAQIQKAADRLAALTAEMNRLTRPPRFEAGELEVGPWMQGVGLRLKDLFGVARVDTHCEPEDLRIHAHSGLLEHILTDAAAFLKPHVTASAAAKLVASEKAGSVMLDLVLKGVRLPEETASRFFDPFSGPKQGADPPLGLAAWVRTLREQGGTLDFSYDEAAGAKLEISFPAVASPAKPSAQPAARVLLVEDEPGIRALMERALDRHGYQVASVSGAADALAQLRESREAFQLLIADLSLGLDSGLDLARQVASQVTGIRVLFISGHSDDPSFNAMAGAGSFPAGSAFLAKPFTVQALLDRVRDLLA